MVTACLLIEASVAGFGPPPTTDYCSMLGEDDIQGKKSGFLAGNKVYYIGGKCVTTVLPQCYHSTTGCGLHAGPGSESCAGGERRRPR